jgi:hypothetical protein
MLVAGNDRGRSGIVPHRFRVFGRRMFETHAFSMSPVL